MSRYFSVAFSTIVGAVLLTAWIGAPPVTYTFHSTPNEMYVEGGSTIHDWSCPITSLDGSLKADTPDATQAPISPPSRVQVAVPVDAIQCDNDTMNEKLREALKLNSYPEVYFSLEGAQVSSVPDSSADWFQVDAKGELILAGKRKQIELPVKSKRLDGGDLRFVGHHTIRLSDYDIERPSAMFGTIKTSKEVTVHFDVTATPNTQ